MPPTCKKRNSPEWLPNHQNYTGQRWTCPLTFDESDKLGTYFDEMADRGSASGAASQFDPLEFTWLPDRRLRRKTHIYDMSDPCPEVWGDTRNDPCPEIFGGTCDDPRPELLDEPFDSDAEGSSSDSNTPSSIPYVPSMRNSELRARQYGLDPRDFRNMIWAGVPPIIFNILFLIDFG